MDSLKKNYSFSFYLSIAVLLVFLCRIAANKSVLLLYACAHKISLKYLIEKIAIEICCQKCQESNIFCVTTFFSTDWISRVCQIKNIKYIHQNLRYYETIVLLLKCFSWNIHHTVSISLLKTLHLFQYDNFFSIYWYFSYQYILVISFSMWPFYFYKSSNSREKWTLFLLPFHDCAPCLFISYWC
jgi:hypothetical protein